MSERFDMFDHFAKSFRQAVLFGPPLRPSSAFDLFGLTSSASSAQLFGALVPMAYLT